MYEDKCSDSLCGSQMPLKGSAVFDSLSRIDSKVDHLMQELSAIISPIPENTKDANSPTTELLRKLQIIENKVTYLLDSIVL